LKPPWGLAIAVMTASVPVVAAAGPVERALAVPGPGRIAVTLDSPVYEGAREDLGDLRLLDAEGAEVPYLIERVEDEAPAAEVRPQIGNRTFIRGQQAEATLDFGGPTLKTQVTLILSGDNFRRRVKVEGRSREDPRWATLTDFAFVFAVPLPSPARYETVPLPDNNFALLRVTVFNGPDDPPRIEILDASTRKAPHRRPREVPLGSRFRRREDARDHETVLTLDLGARHQPFRGLSLDIADGTFFRGVLVESRVEPYPSAGVAPPAPLAWTSVGETAIYRYDDQGERRESLRLDVSGRARVLRVRIRNRDDRPLTITGATTFVPVERLAFEARPGVQYRLRYGDPSLSAPSYDLARTAGAPSLFAANAQPGQLLAVSSLPVAPAAPAPWTERNPALLWAGLLAVVAALGAVTWKAIRTAG
jgi:Protein of unknown function (DUF3999)